jgi:hypothetical protein
METYKDVSEAPQAQDVPEGIAAGGYFTWYDRDGTGHTVTNPSAEYCYPMWEGAIAGYNGTNARVLLHFNSDCSQNPLAYVDPGLSWRDPNVVYWGFHPVA